MTSSALRLRARSEQQLREARDAAESAASAKARFLAMMSHELRTPMTGILGMTELLHETSLDDGQRRIVEVLDGSARSLLTVLNDVLDYSKIDAGKLRLESIDFRPDAVLGAVASLLAPAASARGNALFSSRPTLEIQVVTAQQGWRQQYFGSTSNSGAAADTGDGDNDGPDDHNVTASFSATSAQVAKPAATVAVATATTEVAAATTATMAAPLMTTATPVAAPRLTAMVPCRPARRLRRRPRRSWPRWTSWRRRRGSRGPSAPTSSCRRRSS
jgi:hypothetical protein